MNRFEQEEVVNITKFLKEDLSKIQSKSETISKKIKFNLKLIERLNEILNESKQSLFNLSQSIKISLEKQKSSFLKFDRQKFEELLHKPSNLSSIFLDLLKLKTRDSFSYEELKNRMQVFQRRSVENALIEKIENIDSRFENFRKNEKVLLAWMKNALAYDKLILLATQEKLNIKEINEKIHKALDEIKKLEMQKCKYESNQKVIYKFFDHENLTNHSTEATNCSKRSLTNSRSKAKHSFEFPKGKLFVY